MKTTLSENKIRFNVIQKMQAQLGVSTNFLTVPRNETNLHFWAHGSFAPDSFATECSMAVVLLLFLFLCGCIFVTRLLMLRCSWFAV